MKVFVYGTLKPGEENYHYYCDRVIEAKKAYTWGQLYHLPLGYPAMTTGNSKVIGFLLTFSNEAILESLDELEDYNSQRSPQDNEYERQKISVYDLCGEPLGEAWSYVMASYKVKQLQGTLVSSGWWSFNSYQ
ncbi:MAG: gamma-glutamylcyclotransferase [Hydrococcus sp. Prado102]|nr:gamma-glutamylcyclotransferase [Hydrococcus sp. Prado102]